jgi:hypothetical protein
MMFIAKGARNRRLLDTKYRTGQQPVNRGIETVLVISFLKQRRSGEFVPPMRRHAALSGKFVHARASHRWLMNRQ